MTRKKKREFERRVDARAHKAEYSKWNRIMQNEENKV